jgi:PAS domain S-box-containing protein
MAKEKTFFSNILDERIAYRLVLSFALMSIIPMLLTTYIITTIWLPDLGVWTQVSVFLLLSVGVAILGFLLSRTVVITILKTSELAKEIAEGDLSKRLEIRNERSEMSMLVHSFNQITNQLEQKIKDLQVSEEKFRHLVENVPDLLYYLDPDGRVASVNEEVTELLGYAKEDLLDKPLSSIVHPEDYGNYERVLRERRADESRLTKGVRVRLRAKDDNYHTFEINSRGIYRGSNYIGTEGLARDITAQLAFESEREEFLHMLTHDIKNPLSAILFTVYMLRDGTIPSDKHPEYYEKIERACNAVIGLVEDFLEYKKFEIGKARLEVRKVDLMALLRNIARTYGPQASAKGRLLTITGANGESVPKGEGMVVEVDEKYFTRAVENLVTNAIKFAETRIEIGVAEADDEWVTLFVRDDGPGVAETDQDDIFKLFHTLPGSRMKKGIGVGLASAHKMVTAHGGRLWVDSTPGGGCSFLISIPRNSRSLAPATEPA